MRTNWALTKEFNGNFKPNQHHNEERVHARSNKRGFDFCRRHRHTQGWEGERERHTHTHHIINEIKMSIPCVRQQHLPASHTTWSLSLSFDIWLSLWLCACTYHAARRPLYGRVLVLFGLFALAEWGRARISPLLIIFKSLSCKSIWCARN
jgi:hypothetical protein